LAGSDSDIEDGQAVPDPAPGVQSERFLRGAFQNAIVGPGLGPYVAARVGLAADNEACIEFTGRRLRVGARHAFEWDDFALSLGGGVASLRNTTDDTTPDGNDGLVQSGFEFNSSGFGLDVPVVAGWSPPGRMVAVWAGTRLAYESIAGDLPFVVGGSIDDAEASARAFQLSGLGGLSVGVSPVWVRLGVELTVGRASTEITLPWADTPEQRIEDSFTAISVSPAGAVAVEF
jgi:hypothetical protein